MKRLLVAVLFLATSLAVPGLGSSLAGAAPPAGSPGGVFVTGHDPDFHASSNFNPEGARNIIRRAVEFVTFSYPSPFTGSMLLVTGRIDPPVFGHLDSYQGMVDSGYSPDTASAQTGSGDAAIDLATVNFASYDVVVVASDFGGGLRQADLDILNDRSGDLMGYVNNGGGLVAFAESNSSDDGNGQTPDGGQYDFLPFLVSEVVANQSETGYTVTPYGAAMGLTPADVNGNFSHAGFTDDGGLNVVDRDSNGTIISLATRGELICPAGVPQASISDVSKNEGNSGTTPFTFTISIAPACNANVTVNYATALAAPGAGAANSADLTPASGSVTFAPGETSKTVTVLVNGDTTVEANETFFVNISSVSIGIADGQGLGTIINDDVAGRTGAFACRGSGLRLVGIEPGVANGPYSPCKDDAKTVISANLSSGLVNVTSGTLVATTDQEPNNLSATPPTTSDFAKATATVERATVSALGLVNISTVDLRSQASVKCVAAPGGGLVPSLTGSSSFASLRINGASIAVNGSLSIQLPLGLGSVQTNRKVTTANSITQQAVRVQLLGLEVVIAEARAGFTGTNPCAQ